MLRSFICKFKINLPPSTTRQFPKGDHLVNSHGLCDEVYAVILEGKIQF